MMKKLVAGLLAATMTLGMLAGCGDNAGDSNSDTQTEGTDNTGDTDAKDTSGNSNPITVISREDGSGTRGAFVELFGVEEKDDSGEKVDNTTQDAEITNSTSVMMTSVAGNPDAIGYISLGSLNDTVKALKIDGAEATVDNIKSGTYKISRPFNIAVKEGLSEVAQDFVDFILSSEGQKVVEDSGYITVNDSAEAYAGSKPSGKIVVAGSSSVTPVMEALKEAYLKVNSGAEIEVQQSDSTTGMQSAMDGICDIGMASRELKDSETGGGLKATQIALDGIAVIVNKENSTEDMTSDQVKAIYTGETTSWGDIQ
ncbi:phosphate ABC transporter substrate-binding protein [Lactonifactor longoviformis]|uniref:Phosphate ABC transporter substrate-binding protein, PhoT family (TC 3.A.1.7.1) n=2 Tax=Lactonifactor TaxID=420345 RepID=A0A1M4SQN5_9CLOT|nr:substrate-binding domain-containing protein [Lactonifactor longoviformis]POP34228.1 phosphate ABC transporter substrate-binding protein [Lactonifactor longoviformis]SHE34543.1 phosphate ABC transporter substrate-binding protein, PhoT family (TC 3.A.1.7.1) [Lactonifactor longoviformis DSM 17459]